ncbi:MAG: beta-ketoacyl-ACP synthase II [Clostridia bacterium]|nr:beta-ketoacyl-ACP synthase II [Clostridia bacterium]
MKDNKRVVVTGMGVVSSLGLNCSDFWENVKKGICGISLVERFDTTEFPTKVAAEIKNFNPEDYLDRKDIRRLDRYSHYSLIAAIEAFNNAKLTEEDKNNVRMGVIVTTSTGGVETMLEQYEIFKEKGYKRISPFVVPMMIPNMGAGRIAIEFGAKGFVESVITACASSANAIGDAYRIIQRGEADIMIAGGSDATLIPLTFAGFCAANKSMTQSEDPLTACRPFDIERDGFTMAEGAGILVLEEYEKAVGRGADIICEIVGYACTCDAFHFTAPEPTGDGARRCMELAMKDADIDLSQLGYINAHGTGTPLNDKMEAMAINDLYNGNNYDISVTASKSITGHGMGAAGAIEAIITSLSIKEGYVTPTIGTKNIDPECFIDGIVLEKGINKNINYGMSNSFGFGGHNATLIFKKTGD